MDSDNLYATYDNGKFRITWKFRSNNHELKSYDRIEVRETNGDDEDITCAVQVTESSLNFGTVVVRPVAPLNMADGKYYAAYISSSNEEEIARSSFFSANNLAAASFEENFLVDSDDCIINVIQVHAVHVPGKENVEIDIEWKFKEDTGSLLSKNDYICIIPSKKAEDLKSVYSEHAHGLASGKPRGKVSIQLGGYVSTSETYQVYYLFNHNINGIICKGASEPFAIDDDVVPPFKNLAATRAASQQHNISTMTQYLVQERLENMKAESKYNPLLTIIPKKGEVAMEIKKGQNDHTDLVDDFLFYLEEVREMDEADKKYAETDNLINESHMTKQITNAFRRSPCFLFAGAGISTDAPSLAPSWWDLMRDVLKETLNTIPDDLQDIVMKLRTSKSARHPEEVMGTYYFILGEKLFDLFKFLGKGQPNASHKTIAKMAKSGKLKAIMTPNVDEFIEQALEEEDIDHQVICTNEEFKDYYKNGCEKFAVLKIHGTVSQPQTIVAVASNYKVSGGFEGYKGLVAQYFIGKFPTLFLGYSGWDFAHASSQAFWDAVGKKDGEDIYFMKLKESIGDPLISEVVGRHVGDRLVIGEGTLPETIISVWDRFDFHQAERIRKFHSEHSSLGHRSIRKMHQKHIKFWVQQIPKCFLMAILLNESYYLNENMKLQQEQVRKKRMRDDAGPTIMSAATTEGITERLVDLAMKFSQGIITNEVYMEKQRLATIELNLAPLSIPKKKKELLIKL